MRMELLFLMPLLMDYSCILSTYYSLVRNLASVPRFLRIISDTEISVSPMWSMELSLAVSAIVSVLCTRLLTTCCGTVGSTGFNYTY